MKKIISIVFALVFVISLSITGFAQDGNIKYKSIEDIIEYDNIRIKQFLNCELNKITTKVDNTVTPMWSYREWFERYEPNTLVEKKDAYLLADIDFDTRGEAGDYSTVTLRVEESRTVSTETAASIEVTGEIKAAMFASLQAKFGSSITDSTTTSNQVGVDKDYNVMTGRTGSIKAYYMGIPNIIG